MALSPLNNIIDRANVVQTENQPLKTYEFDFAKGEFTGFYIDNTEAIRQFIQKALVTPRFRYLIYDSDFGSELEDLIGQDVTSEFLESEVPRIIEDALLYDERISSVGNITLEKDPTSDALFITLTVTTSDGIQLSEEVTI